VDFGREESIATIERKEVRRRKDETYENSQRGCYPIYIGINRLLQTAGKSWADLVRSICPSGPRSTPASRRKLAARDPRRNTVGGSTFM